MVLQTSGTSTRWVATSTLGIAGLAGGQPGFLSRWLTSTTLGTSSLIDTGIFSGVNATSSSFIFNVQAISGSNTNPFNVASSSGTSLLTVLANGNIGVGTSSPTAKLSVSGGINFTGKLTENGSEIFANMIAPFAGSCPTGWSEYTAARGRTVVGTPLSGTSAGTVGTALTDLGTRTINQVASHVHSVDPPATLTDSQGSHTHGLNNAIEDDGGASYNISGTGQRGSAVGATGAAGAHTHTVDIPAFNSASAGVASVDVTMPYIQLTYCQKAVGSDIAEWIPATGDLSKETIISTDPNNREHVIASAKEYDTTVVGIIATKPGWLLGQEAKGSVQMALAGRVPVRVSLKNGEIKMEAVNESSSLSECADPQTGRQEKCASALVFLNVSWYSPLIDQTADDQALQLSSAYYEPISLQNDFTAGDIAMLSYGNAPKEGNENVSVKIGYLSKSGLQINSQVAGVISTTIGGQGELLQRIRSNNKITSEVHLINSGKTEMKISNQSKSINIGDPIAVSLEGGAGIKATQAGPIVARALENWTPNSNRQTISVLVNISWFDPYAQIGSTDAFTIEQHSLDGDYELENTITGEGVTHNGVFSSLLGANIQAGLLHTNELVITGEANHAGVLPSRLLRVGEGDLFQILSTGQVLAVTGTNIKPTYSFDGNSNTGIYSASLNNLRFTTGGEDRLTINSSGLVGIGTNNPTAKLDINGDANITTGLTIGTSLGLAENYKVSTPLISGTVVTLATTTLEGSTSTDDIVVAVNKDVVLGIVAIKPSIILGGSATGSLPVVSFGQTDVLVTNENGLIKKGDLLTLSTSTPGYAMKQVLNGISLGYALADAPSSSTSTIRIVIKSIEKSMALSTVEGLRTLATSSDAFTVNTVSIYDTLVQSLTRGIPVAAEYVAVTFRGVTGYFDKLFAKEIHTEKICIKKSDGTDVCLNGDQLQVMMNSAHLPLVAPVLNNNATSTASTTLENSNTATTTPNTISTASTTEPVTSTSTSAVKVPSVITPNTISTASTTEPVTSTSTSAVEVPPVVTPNASGTEPLPATP
jgi:hypothetical protein